MIKIYNSLMLWPSASFGDTIVTSPIMRHFASVAQKVYLPLKKINESDDLINTGKSLLLDVPNIEIIEHHDYYDYDEQAAKYGAARIHSAEIYAFNYNGVLCCPLWDEQWYTWFNIPFSVRYENFRVPNYLEESSNLYKSIATQPNYILIHKQMGPNRQSVDIDLYSWRSDEQKITFNECQIIEITPDIASNLVHYIDLIRNATEIHCTPSSFFCLVDSITTQTKAKLYYHNIRANTLIRVNNQWNNYRWTLVNYDRKL